MSHALVIGGTGPTGPHIVAGLIDRGYDVTILHRGIHEVPGMDQRVEHIHVDPFDQSELAAGLRDRTFDVAVAAYGRLRLTAHELVDRVPHVVAVGGVPAYRGFFVPSVNQPYGFPVPVTEDFPVAELPEHGDRSMRVARAEAALFELAASGAYTACLFRYPYVYGPAQLVPREWSIIRRILDGRRVVPLPDDGLALLTHGYVLNIAHSVLLAIDAPGTVNGKAYNCGDQEQLSLRQCIEVIAATMGEEVAVVGTPDVPGHPLTAFCNHQLAHHRLMSIASLERDLGYADVVPAVEAMRTTTRHYLESPPTGDLERNLQDPFDYVMEDELIELARRQRAEATVLCGEQVRQHHPYDTPASTDLKHVAQGE